MLNLLAKRRALMCACSVLAFAIVPATDAIAQEANAAPPQQSVPEPAKAEEVRDPRQIVVIGNRIIIAALEDLEPERQYDEDEVASYGVSTVGELLDEIRSENGDAEPTVLINGRPSNTPNDIADLPVEAIQRVEQLPRGAAQRIGGRSGERAYNVVLKPSVRSATLTAGQQVATEGGWRRSRGEALLTYVRDNDRINLSLRHSDSGFLLESERDVIPRPQTFPFAPLGNVIPFAGTEVDPALSALAGKPVQIVALNGDASPTLASLVARAGVTNPSGFSSYRSLRSASSPWEVAVTGNKELADWLAFSFSGRLNWTDSESLRGLPTGRVLVPATNPFTPFTVPVVIALNDPSRPLRSLGDNSTQAFSGTFNANFGEWRAALTAGYNSRKSKYISDLNGSFAGGLLTVAPTQNPFAGGLAQLIGVNSRQSISRFTDRSLVADLEGPIANLPAGPLRVRLGASVVWTDFESTDFLGFESFDRRELTAKAGLTIPLTGEGLLPSLGSSDLALDIARVDVSDAGTIKRYAVAFNWSPADWLRITLSQFADGTAIYPELLAAPQVITENVPYFDPLREETVDVRLIAGGFASLRNETERTRSLSVTATPPSKYNLQLNAELQQLIYRNQLGSLPEPSSAVVAAFPDRFIRDNSGQLVSVDTSSINFARERTNQLRLGASVTIPLAAAQRIPATGTEKARRIPATNLQMNVSHTLVLDSNLLIRDGLPSVDLLDGGAIGVAGNKLRNLSTATVALTRGGTGIRMSANYRGPSYLQIGTITAPDRLVFGSLFQLDAKAFVDLGQLFTDSKVARGTRLTLVVDNLLNDRQRVTNGADVVPQAYQPFYRDPLGRTVSLELRKVF